MMPIREQAEKGGWDFNLLPVYFIAILDFHYDEKEEERKFRRDVCLKDQDGDVLLFQVGKFYEFYHHQDDSIALSLGLQRMRSNRRGARFGFPVVRESFYCQLLLQRSLTVLLIRETDDVCNRLRQRLPINKTCLYNCSPTSEEGIA